MNCALFSCETIVQRGVVSLTDWPVKEEEVTNGALKDNWERLM